MLIGLLNHFEKTFELSWKLMKDILYFEGVSEAASGSPLTILKSAYHYGLITDEAMWKATLTDRNNLSHRYDSAILEEMAVKIKEDYLTLFSDLLAVCSYRLCVLLKNELLPDNEIDEILIEMSTSFEELEP